MDERLKTNLDLWNEGVGVHMRAPSYNLDGFRRGENVLFPLELAEVGDVRGKSLLHLQCHFGMDTMSWARLGASVTGLDFSDQAIEAARKLSAELKIPAAFVCSDIYAAPSVLKHQFDIVFTSYGALCWLPDLKRWAQIAARFVKPGGIFYISEFHPLTQCYDTENPVELKSRISYFETAQQNFSPGPDYSDRSAMLSHGSHEWMYTTAGVVTALIDAGLRIEFVHEHPVCCGPIFPFMEQSADRWWRIKGDPIPLTLSIRARKPA
ncbi:MAG TPA: class I SAM-dependent methyltransferase [Candidatus Binataceae bacterium]|nr:class I SAM-dependent methyltransferase [Candidatus Binataceae bacterium]